MKNKVLLHTTEGVRDYYGTEYSDRETVSRRLFQTMELFGFSGIDTPSFEYFDLFAGELSQASARDLYKFFDKEGETLVLRPDLTPSIARSACRYYLDQAQGALRLCYRGQTFMNTSSLQGKLNEYTQTGAELMNDGSVYADAEMIALLAECLLAAGLTEFQISVGNASYFKAICSEAGIDGNLEEELREQIAVKNYFAAEKLLTDAGVSDRMRDLLLKVSSFMKTEEEIAKALSEAPNAQARDALLRLKELDHVLSLYGVDKYVSYDLSMLNRYQYYTGVIFRAYTYGVGDAIASGGRYDELLDKFGHDAPAIGFAIVLEDLMNALYRQKIEVPKRSKPETVIATKDSVEESLQRVLQLRKEGQATVFDVRS